MKKIFSFLLLLPLFLLSSCKGECDFKITFFNVGNADAILIQDKNTNIIIDTGTEESSDYFLEGLEKLNIKTIDYLILSHFDQDHIGGASKLLTTYDVKQIYQTYFVKTSKEIRAYQDALKEKNILDVLGLFSRALDHRRNFSKALVKETEVFEKEPLKLMQVLLRLQ